MRQYEVTFIVDPVLSVDEIKATAEKFVDFLKGNDCNIVHVDEMGLRQLAYPINKRNSGVYYCVEFQSENGGVVSPLELNMKRDERLLRFLTVSLDKYGVKYNEDKRAGKIGKKKTGDDAAAPKKEVEAEKKEVTKTPKLDVKPTPTPSSPPVATEQKDDLKKIEGIGPKIEKILNDAGIATFVKLGVTPDDDVRKILADAGSQFTSHDPTTWNQQAKLAADGKWTELEELQGELKGGRIVDKSEEE